MRIGKYMNVCVQCICVCLPLIYSFSHTSTLTNSLSPVLWRLLGLLFGLWSLCVIAYFCSLLMSSADQCDGPVVHSTINLSQHMHRTNLIVLC